MSTIYLRREPMSHFTFCFDFNFPIVRYRFKMKEP